MQGFKVYLAKTVDLYSLQSMAYSINPQLTWHKNEGPLPASQSLLTIYMHMHHMAVNQVRKFHEKIRSPDLIRLEYHCTFNTLIN